MGTRTGSAVRLIRNTLSGTAPQVAQSEPNPTAAQQYRGIRMMPVESSNVESIGYNAKTQELGVKFKNNDRVYISPGVPEYVWDGFLTAASKGSYFARVIKGKYL